MRVWGMGMRVSISLEFVGDGVYDVSVCVFGLCLCFGVFCFFFLIFVCGGSCCFFFLFFFVGWICCLLVISLTWACTY